MKKALQHISKFMSLILRHQPEVIGLELDEHGWADVKELIEKINQHGLVLDMVILDEVVSTNEKRRFAFNEDKTKIRASQGHSIEAALDLPAIDPPEFLYHGTAVHFLDSILVSGLQKQRRQHVHLSDNEHTAKAVGSRHGKPVILRITAKAMCEAGYKFYLSANNVWLTDAVPVEFIEP